MARSDREILIDNFAFNQNVIHRQTDGLTHADSLLQLPFRGNCLNWVLGHILDTRNTVLKLLGAQPVFTKEEASLYGHGSDPITGEGKALPLERLLADLDESQNRIATALQSISPEALAAEIEMWKGKTPLVEHLGFLNWHETYHVGQLELLRQLAGKNDAII
jgi:uncharacterized damage-inducible protein DinB